MTLICEALRATRSSGYGAGIAASQTAAGKRGPRTALTDDELLEAIRAVLAACPFHSEGHCRTICRRRGTRRDLLTPRL